MQIPVAKYDIPAKYNVTTTKNVVLSFSITLCVHNMGHLSLHNIHMFSMQTTSRDTSLAPSESGNNLFSRRIILMSISLF